MARSPVHARVQVFKAKETPKKKQTQARGRGKAMEFMRFRSPGGMEVVAGRSSAQNDRVTWSVAKDKVRGSPSQAAPCCVDAACWLPLILE